MKHKNKSNISQNVSKKKHINETSKIDTEFFNNYGNQKKWYNEFPSYNKECSKLPDDQLIELKNEAKRCNDAETANYNIKNSKANSDYKWMKTVMSKGIVSDKIAAFTVLIQDDPVCNLNTIYNLVNMVKVGKKKECLAVMETLTELFLNDLLKPDAKLTSFHEQPLSKLEELSSGNNATRNKYLSFWYFEDQLKEYFTMFMQALKTAAHDTVEANKEKAINSMYKLLSGNPEQEKNLLSNIINKLGDPSQKVASKVIYCLGQLVYHHPNMRSVVLNEIERLLFRTNISQKAQYYSICFLSQFYLASEDFDLAKDLIILYFAFFKACVKKGDVDSRMMSALLMGVNRAYPYAKYNLTNISEHIDTMYKVVHLANFNVSLHALNLLYQISDHNNTVNDRFYCALYKKLLENQMGTTTHQAILLNLIFRALKRDNNVNRVRAFIKRLLQVALNVQPSMACGILFLMSKLIYKTKTLLALEYKKDIIIDNIDEYEHCEDVKLDNNEEIKTNSENKNKYQQSGNMVLNLIEEDIKPDLEDITISTSEEPKAESSCLHVDKAIKSEFNHDPIISYNAYHRNPLYAGGEFCIYIELLQLKKHFHPTVALFASNILNSENINYSGDPLKDFTLVKFLERFAFKNPKKIEDIQKPGISSIFGRRKMYTATGVKSLAINSAGYLNETSKKIPIEELFMYSYLQRRNEERKATKKKNKVEDDDESDADSVASEEFEAMLNQMGGKKLKDNDEIDFMNELGDALKTKKSNKGNEDSDEEDEMSENEEDTDNDDFDDDFEGEQNNFGDEDIDDLAENEDGFNDIEQDDDDLDIEDNESDIEFGSDDSDVEENPSKNKNNKIDKNDLKNIFASAEEFASLLDEDAEFTSGSSGTLVNKDRSHKKQLVWEKKRNRWIKGADNMMGKTKNKSFPKKRSKSESYGNKNKRQKR